MTQVCLGITPSEIHLDKGNFHCLVKFTNSFVLFNYKFLQFRVETLHGQSHDIEIRTFDTFHPDLADPFLYTIGTGLVHRMETSHIVQYLLIGEGSKGYITA